MLALAGLFLLAAPSAPAQQYRAFWADAFNRGFKSTAEVEELVENAVAARANAIFMQARRRGDVYYLKSAEPPAQDPAYSPNYDALDYLIDRAHARGLEVHAWFVVSRVWTSADPPRDPRHIWHSHGPNVRGDDFWMAVSSAGVVGDSLDLGHPAAAQHVADLVVNVARDYPAIDGLHLDYIRYPEEADFGWNPKAIERFQRLDNRTGSPARTDSRWADFRRRQVTQLVRQIYLRANAIKPSIKISAALITWGDGPGGSDPDAAYRRLDAYSRVFQDWRGWLEEGILDLAMPMNYFDESRYAAWLDNWLRYEKDRQFRRGMIIGLGVYLNPIAATIGQLPRVLATTAAGSLPLGVCFYSYATTNNVRQPNSDFYRAVAEYFQSPAVVPELPWKTNATSGHLYGWLRVDGGPEWLKDGAAVHVESDTGAATARRLTTDGSGFFGAVDLPPDRYRVRIERGGSELYRSVATDVKAGATVPFEIFLKAADFAAVLPTVRAVSTPVAAPGDILALAGSAFAANAGAAASVPLPFELSGAQVVVNGEAAPLFEITADRIELQTPYRTPEAWTIVVKHQGLESTPITIGFTPARPVILGVRSAGDRFLEIHATGLGMVSPPVPPGSGAPDFEPLPRVTGRTVVLLKAGGGEFELEPAYAGLTPYYPGRYQVNVRMPENVSQGEIRLRVGDVVSAPVQSP
ncbi:MAG: family 10 glycosylhydrolase [Acidobacteria bacterium]|nr:family 10 glycosylhydrolase [Acidobacteriota bacterium]